MSPSPFVEVPDTTAAYGGCEAPITAIGSSRLRSDPASHELKYRKVEPPGFRRKRTRRDVEKHESNPRSHAEIVEIARV